MHNGQRWHDARYRWLPHSGHSMYAACDICGCLILATRCTRHVMRVAASAAAIASHAAIRKKSRPSRVLNPSASALRKSAFETFV